jgi:ATP-binding cassette subfamily B protein
LDTATEQDIQAALRAVSSDRTTLVIAHRLSTVVDADEIVVLDEGRVIERGRHAALLALGGLYAHMWAIQAEQRDQPEVASAEAAGISTEAAARGSADPTDGVSADAAEDLSLTAADEAAEVAAEAAE